MDEPQAGSDDGSADPVSEGETDPVEHLRAAAHELIGAMRGFLDIAEELVDDPKAREAVVDTVAGFAEAARQGARSAVRDMGDHGSDDEYEHIDLDD